jgi:hypothetical protein
MMPAAIGNSVRLCMEAAGYEWVYYNEERDKRCVPSFTQAANPYCYRPISWLGKRIYEFERDPYTISK